MLKNYRFEIPDILLTTWPTSLQLKLIRIVFHALRRPLQTSNINLLH